LKVDYTEEALADIVDAITYLNERNPRLLQSWTPRSRGASNAWQPGSSMARSRD